MKKKMMKMYEELESPFKIIYPHNENATYVSILNSSDDVNKPFQRWFRYKEGYSVDFVYKILDDNTLTNGKILDPFSGSGTTLLAAQNRNLHAIGFEVNPFTCMLSECKLHKYTKSEIVEFETNIHAVLTLSKKSSPLPERDMMKKVFSKEVESQFLSIKHNILHLKVSKNILNLYLLGWVSLIELFSNYKKSGNGLKKRKKTGKDQGNQSFIDELQSLYRAMLSDIKGQKSTSRSTLIKDSCLHLDKYIENNSIDGVIFSPPYANCFDYTEIYKLELWFGDFVETKTDLKELRNLSVRSHLNANFIEETIIESAYLEKILETLQEKPLWDQRIPRMLRLYFHDMFLVLKKLLKVMKKNAFCTLVVSNSAYGGIVIPTDLLIAQHADDLGFSVEKIEIDRYIITSSQQYKNTLEYKKYLRESIICLRKK